MEITQLILTELAWALFPIRGETALSGSGSTQEVASRDDFWE